METSSDFASELLSRFSNPYLESACGTGMRFDFFNCLIYFKTKPQSQPLGNIPVLPFDAFYLLRKVRMINDPHHSQRQLMRLQPRLPHAHFHFNRHFQHNSRLHLLLNHRQHGFFLTLEQIKNQFVVDLQKHFSLQV
jgi:hypothetical protein